MTLLVHTPYAALGLFVVMLLLIEIGRLLHGRPDDTRKPGTAAMESAVFALFGLLLAFTFSGAMGRYDAHRELIVRESNNIGTAYLRLDLLPPDAQPALRKSFRDYTAVRARRFNTLDDTPEAIEAAAQTIRLQNEIWTRAVAAAASPAANVDATKLLLPALNDMIDITITRRNAFDMHPPDVVFFLLFALACGGALLAGFSMTGRRSWLHCIVFSASIALTLYTTLDIEYPRRGIITLASRDQIFLDLLRSMR